MLDRVRSALYLPASNPRAIEKARTSAADLVILDLEDAVKAEDKDRARAAAVEAAAGFGRPVAIRVNGAGTAWHQADLAAVRKAAVDYVVLPKVEHPGQAMLDLPMPVLAMIETPTAIFAAHGIAAAAPVAGLIAGTNDLAAELRLPPGAPRTSLALSLQTIVLAARAAGILALDGVYNAFKDETGLALECADGRALGFDGKTLIHPDQIAVANRAFGPSAAEIEEARALIAAFTGGAERYGDRMIEGMHVAAARRLLAMADAGGDEDRLPTPAAPR
ncbi:CoA ester lyase [Sphingomonas sp. 1P06PA]|uniref:HpcH/HpaI aldolase/citrate lyase family protein n=1 Tax=Sphingomonas sp. 1P06PA TaxID=554121 RepID=UPI0039A60E51